MRSADLETVEAEPTPTFQVPTPPQSELRMGSRFARYVILEPVGAGGMATVYRAHDPELARDVALKVLLPRRSAPETNHQSHARLLREARALAALSHPNVVAVFDVFAHAGRVAIAMELVQGATLRDWLRAQRRTPREVLTVFGAAGRGLAAAHTIGIIHRDFKPANVLIGAGGRPRVADFGLARVVESASSDTHDPSEPPTNPSGATSRASHTSRITRAGTVVGTPVFMSPEQHRGGEVGPATDQYSFAVALWRALYRTWPFAVSPPLGSGKLAPPPPPPPDSGVPRHVHRTLVRALSVRPEDRFPSMAELLRSLERTRSHRRWFGLGSVVLGLGLVWGLGPDPRGVGRCSGADDGWNADWNPSAAAALAEAFASDVAPHSAATLPRTLEALDHYESEWKTTYRAACEAALPPTEATTRQLDAQMGCLAQAQREMTSLVRLLRRADGTIARNAMAAAYSLTPPRMCLAYGVEVEASRLWESADAEAVREGAADAKALLTAGKYQEALAVIGPLEQTAQTLGDTRARAELMLVSGEIHAEAGEPEHALNRLEEAEFAARSSGADDIRAEALRSIVFVVGVRLDRTEDALEWGRHAMAAAKRLGTPLAEGRVLTALGAVSLRRGEYDQALGQYEHARALLERADDRLGAARALERVGTIYFYRGDYDSCVETLDTTYRALSQALGPDHPDPMATLMNRAVCRMGLGEFEDAKVDLERVASNWRAAYGPDHFKISEVLQNLAGIDEYQGRSEDALVKNREVLRLRELAVGPDHTDVAAAKIALAGNCAATGRRAEAAKLLREAITVEEQTLGADHPDLISDLATLAILEAQLEDRDAARRLIGRARVLAESPDADPSARAIVDYELARIEYLAGHLEDAQGALERAVEAGDPAGSFIDAIAAPRFALARLLAEQRRAPERVETLVGEALTVYRTAGYTLEAAEVEAWRAEVWPTCRVRRCRASLGE